MTFQRKKHLLDFLDYEIKKASENALKTDEASKFVVAGFSQSGDKYHAISAANLAKLYLERLQKLRKEIEIAKEGISEKVEPVCFVEIEYGDQSRLQFILANEAVSLTRFLFISKDSPLGRAVLGKKVAENFSYEIGSNTVKSVYSGKIVNIE